MSTAMTPARSVAVGLIALGFASTFTASLPALAAPAPCKRAENYAAQSGAEMLRIDRLDLHPAELHKPAIKSKPSKSKADDYVRDSEPDRTTKPTDPAGSDADSEAGNESDNSFGSSGSDSTSDSSATDETGAGGDGEVVGGRPDLTRGDSNALTGDADSAVSRGLSSGSRAAGAHTSAAGSRAPAVARLGKGPAVPSAGLGHIDEPGSVRGRGVGWVPAAARVIEGLSPATGAELPARREASPGAGSPGAGSPDTSSPDTSSPDTSSPDAGSRDAASPGKGDAALGTSEAAIGGVGLGEARSALVANAQVNSVALARMLNGAAPGKDSFSKPIVRQAPPNNSHAIARTTAPGRVGPFTLGGGDLGAQARWDAGMACGGTEGEASRGTTSLDHVDVLPGGGGALVRVPGNLSSLSTTALERDGDSPRTVASATVAGGRFVVLRKIQVTILRPPVLTSSATVSDGGSVDYRPALVEVTAPGIGTKRLSAAGDCVDIPLGDDSKGEESATAPSALGGLRAGAPLPTPAIHGLPSIGWPKTESAPTAGTGTRVRIGLGQVRQATNGHAVAAKVIAITVAVTESEADASRTKNGYGGENAVGADLGFGALETAAVAPETVPATGARAVSQGLPITGPQAEAVAIGGLSLMLSGAIALFIGRRRRDSTP